MKSKLEKHLRSGDKFTAKDKLGRVFHYIFIGIDLSDLENGTGCRYIMLKNLDNGNNVDVEAAWFTQRTIILE